ncbi:MAG TPA: hypothetical protein VKT51_00370 [Candidatus Eremiobacteraceae bacterium]|nr:hypothetical protein [Candidatus Eremiobacteraceae bacterium]
MRPFVTALAATTIISCAACGRATSENSGAAARAPQAAGTPSPAAAAATSAATPSSLTFSDKSGTVKIGQGAVDPSSLGVPLYPDAVQDPSSSSSSVAADGSTKITTLSTVDSYAQVNAWYKAHLPGDAQASHLSVGAESTTSYQWTRGDGRENRVVTVSTNYGKPIITISVSIDTATPAP